MKLTISKRDISRLGLLIFLCGSYLSNVASVICFFIFVALSFTTIIRRKIGHLNRYSKWCGLFGVYVCISFLWAHKDLMNTTIGTLEIVSVIATFYCSLYVFKFIQNESDFFQLINVLILSLIFLVAYLLVVTPSGVWGTFSLGQNVGINKNTVGMNLAYGGIICFYYLKERTQNKVFNTVIFITFSVLALLAGSRKGLLILIGGIVLYYILCERNAKMARNILMAVGSVILVYFLVMNIPVLYEMVGERTETLLKTFLNSSSVTIEEDKSIWERSYYRQYAMDMFFESPFYTFFGHGLEGFRTRMAEIGYSHVAYSHCNYTELLANFGITGFFIYYFYKVKIVFKSVMIKNRPKVITFFMIILTIQLVMDYGMVSYYDTFTQFTYILGYCVIRKKIELENMQERF